MKEFQVNNYINLKLEDGKTVVYVAGERFLHCKYLLLNISLEKIDLYDDIKSIDDAAEKLNHSMEDWEIKDIKISPEIEFWAHCSNLQAWAENSYDTNLLHSNISFPLLKKLTDKGDFTAFKVFKEEIAKRLEAKSSSVINYLYENNFVNYLNRDEFWNIFGEDGEVLSKIEQEIRKHKLINKIKVDEENIDAFEYFLLKKEISFSSGPMVFSYEKGRITKIGICGNEKEVWEDSHYELDIINTSFGNIELEKIPESISRLDELI